ncbi:MAG TPA: YlmC/YmxH family sporulation protein [Bacillota bacterium]|nr:YlmC/YmxH family sporulation protein [Bacillota bacterium]
MRYKDISGKEVVHISKGARLGTLGHIDLNIDQTTGQIKSLIIPDYNWFGLKKNDEEMEIPWQSIKKIGEDMILVDDE